MSKLGLRTNKKLCGNKAPVILLNTWKFDRKDSFSRR